MKFLIDNNLSFKLVQPFQPYFPGTVHIRQVLNVEANDQSIWEYEQNNGLTILTKDNDFDELSLLHGCPARVVHLLCGNRTTLYILNLIITYKDDILSFADSGEETCLLKLSV